MNKVLCSISIICGIILLFTGCTKKEKVQQKNSNPVEQNDSAKTKINFDDMKKKVEAAKELNIEVVFAISVLHRQYITELEKEAAKLPPEQQAQLYEAKKNEFFKTIKFSYEEYMKFYTDHIDEMNEYIQMHPELIEYLTILN